MTALTASTISLVTGDSAWPRDAYGHGTHVAGLIAGDGNLSDQRYRGVAPRARLIVLKVLDENGAGYTSDVIDAIEFVTRNKARLGVDIINLSLGHPILEPAATDPLVQAVEAAVRAGIVVVAAAGNYGVSPATGEPAYAGILSPGNAPSAITVGSARTFETNMRGDDRVANYSSRGPTWYDGTAKPDLVAPGHGLVAAAATIEHALLEQSLAQSRRVLSAAQWHEHGNSSRERNSRSDPGNKSQRVSIRNTSDAERGEGHPSVHGVSRP